MKNVIFLGAGASKADGAPMQNELFPKFFEMYRQDEDGLKGNQYCQEVVKYFLQVFGYDVALGPFEDIPIPTFEEAMGMIDISAINDVDFDRGKANKYHNHFTEDWNNSIRRSLLYVIASTIDKALRRYANRNNQLVENLFAREYIENSFITTNYDIIIDKALMRAGRGPVYGFEHLQGNSRDAYGASLFKLHGSFNWLRCPVCNEIDVDKNEKSIMRLFDHSGFANSECPHCRSGRKPVIIPPTFFKDYSSVFIQTIWRIAEKALQDADNIVFCGYSFPDADIHIKHLLKKSELRNRNHPRIFIINNYPGKEEKEPEMIKAEKERYLRFFSDKYSINYTEYSFQEFANDPYMILT